MSWWVCHWVPESNEYRWSMVATTILLRWMHTYLLFWWHTLWQLGKALNKRYKHKYHTTSQDINKQIAISCKTMQKTRVYILSLKSNTKLSPQHPQRSRHCERPQLLERVLLEKRFWCFLGHLSFWVSSYFLYKKIKNKNKYKITWTKCFIVIDWIEINIVLINWILQGLES